MFYEKESQDQFCTNSVCFLLTKKHLNRARLEKTREFLPFLMSSPSEVYTRVDKHMRSFRIVGYSKCRNPDDFMTYSQCPSRTGVTRRSQCFRVIGLLSRTALSIAGFFENKAL